MLVAYATGTIAVVLMVLVWVWVQQAWARTFADDGAVAEPDVLARRRSCDGCSCTGICRREKEEENRGGLIDE